MITMMQGMKICGRCGTIKERSEFWRRTASVDGLQHWCKDCQRRWRMDHPGDSGVTAGTSAPASGGQYELFEETDRRGHRYVRFDLNSRNEVLNVLALLKTEGYVKRVIL